MADNKHSSRQVLTILRIVIVFLLVGALLTFGILMLAAPELVTQDAGQADGARIRNSLYGIILVAAGLLLLIYQLRQLIKKYRHNPQSDEGGSVGDDATPGAGSIDGQSAGIGGVGGDAVTSASDAAHPDGEIVEDGGRIIRIPRDTLDDELRRIFQEGCAWLDAGELKDAAFPVALLIPTRSELLAYLAEHYPPRTIMMADHLGAGSGLPYFVNEGVHLHCAMVNRPADVERMLDHYSPTVPLACVLVAGNMHLDTRGTDANQMRTIRNSVIGLLCRHSERNDYILVTPR